jgi:trk system potassium uptake protein TrkH
MNKSFIRYILGTILKAEGVFLLLPVVIAAIYRESTEGVIYLGSAAVCFLAGFLISFKKPESYVFYLKEGCVATSLSWIVLAMAGAVPFVLTGEIPSYTDALFETVSGFTTTGASILSDIEAVSHASLTWRSFTHWIGGMGVLVFIIAIIPMAGGSNINLMRAESPGPSVGKLVPKIRYTARLLYVFYVGLTVLQFVLLIFAGMPAFDSLNTAFATAGTGGFGIKNDSLTSYSVAIQWITTIFMILFGINFNAYYFLFFGSIKKVFEMEEVRYYLGIIAVSIAIITVDIRSICSGFFDALTKASFQVASIISTAGFSTTDFDLWSSTSKTILVILMFVGACAGSTGGGMKVSRFVIMFKTIFKELNSYIYPHSVRKIKLDGKPVEHDVVRSVNVYFFTFAVIFVTSVFALSFEGFDLITNFTAVASCINDVGPGLSMVGPTQNFSCFGAFSKYVLMFDMLAGRLELFPLLILFHPVAWKSAVKKCK